MLQECCCEIYLEIEILIRQNANHVQSQAEYKEHYSDLVSQYEDLKVRLAGLEADRQSRVLRRQKILHFLESLRQMYGLLQEFDEGIFRAMTERMTVYSKKDISVTFKDGNEVHIDLGE